MCGIAGTYRPRGSVTQPEIQALLTPMAHRGPDDRGIEILAGGQVGLGHLRLSILDTSAAGHQPMVSQDSTAWVVFNGELYNFRQIRRELEELGNSFRTASDTEVLLCAYRQWGLDCIAKFHGMFAFAIWDG